MPAQPSCVAACGALKPSAALTPLRSRLPGRHQDAVAEGGWLWRVGTGGQSQDGRRHVAVHAGGGRHQAVHAGQRVAQRVPGAHPDGGAPLLRGAGRLRVGVSDQMRGTVCLHPVAPVKALLGWQTQGASVQPGQSACQPAECSSAACCRVDGTAQRQGWDSGGRTQGIWTCTGLPVLTAGWALRLPGSCRACGRAAAASCRRRHAPGMQTAADQLFS